MSFQSGLPAEVSNGLISSAFAEKEPAVKGREAAAEPVLVCIMPRDPQRGGGGTLKDMSAQPEPLCMLLSLFNRNRIKKQSPKVYLSYYLGIFWSIILVRYKTLLLQ